MYTYLPIYLSIYIHMSALHPAQVCHSIRDNNKTHTIVAVRLPISIDVPSAGPISRTVDGSDYRLVHGVSLSGG